MSYFISLTAIFMAVFALNYFSKQKVELLFPIVNLGIVFLLYIFGLCQILFVGGFVILFSILCLFGFALFKIIKNKKKDFVKQFFSPIVILLLVFSVAQFIALYGMEVVSWDELTHWGLVVKNMFYYRNFGGGALATTMFKGYPVGSSLFLYFFEMFGFNFQPAHLYMAMNLLNISLLLPVVSKFNNNKQKLLFALAIILTALLFNVKMFASIWNDQFLSIAFAYVLISYFCFITKEGLPKINLISLLLGTFVLVSAKSTGLILVIFAFIIIGLDLIINQREILKNQKKNFIIAIVLALLAVLIPKVSWSLYLKTIDIGGAWQTSNLTIGNIINYLFNPTSFQRDVTKNFFLKLLWPFGTSGNAGSAPIPFVIDLAIMICLIVIIKNKTTKKKGLVLGLGLLITFLAYIVGTLISYIFTFSSSEALRLASFVRYMNTYVLGILLFLVSYVFSLIKPQEATNFCIKTVTIISSVVMLIGLVVSPIISNKMNNAMQEYNIFISGVENLKRTDRVYIIDTEEDMKNYLIMRYMATPIETSGLKIGGSPHIGDMWNSSMQIEDVCEDIVSENYNYLYLHNIDNAFIENYSFMFDDEPKEKTFYNIVNANGNLSFIIN